MLMQEHEVLEHNVHIILLTDTINAYILEFDSKYELYIADIRECAMNDDATLVKVFNDKEEALNFIRDVWFQGVREVFDFYRKYNYTKDKPATQKQINATYGQAKTMSDATWFFVKRTCYYRIKDVINEKLGKPVHKNMTEKERFLSMALDKG
jgi:hypothetical protein